MKGKKVKYFEDTYCTNPLVSIIVPVYNKEHGLDRCILSILHNNYSNFELLLINDGSTDDSLKVCRMYEKIDRRVSVINKKNTGVSDTRNLGIQKARGEWISFVDADDYIEPDRYTKTIPIGVTHQCPIVVCSMRCFGGCNNIIKSLTEGEYKIEDRVILKDLQHDLSNVCIVVYKTNLIKDIRFPKCSYGEDYLFNIKAYTLSGRLYSVFRPLYNYQNDYKHDNTHLTLFRYDENVVMELKNAINETLSECELYSNFEFYKDSVLNNIKLRFEEII